MSTQKSTKSKSGTASLDLRTRAEIRARKRYVEEVQRNIKRQQHREELLKVNDRLVQNAHERYDEHLSNVRKRVDERLKQNREKIEERYVKGDKGKREKLHRNIAKTDELIAHRRKRRNKAVARHRSVISRLRIRYQKRFENLYRRFKSKALKRLRLVERGRWGVIVARHFGACCIIVLVFFFTLILTFILVRVGIARKKHKEREAAFAQMFVEVPVLDEEEKLAPEELLWKVLYEHFDGNETAVVGVMCNVHAESDFRADNLENLNNKRWEVEDDEYTSKVNNGVVTKEDFLFSRYNGETQGHVNKYLEWVNVDGGYGFVQCTSFDKKQEMFEFAEAWFAEGGPGEKKKFSIADPEMQANFLVYLLDSPEYNYMDAMLRHALTDAEACYVWLKYYEIPRDPYRDGYQTLACERAEIADNLRQMYSSENN